MDNSTLRQRLEELTVNAVYPVNKQYTEIIIPAESYHEFCSLLKNSQDMLFDYLISLTAVDWKDHFMIVCHITSTIHRHTIIVKTQLSDYGDPVADTVSDIWRTAEFHEREVFDLFGIRFRHHPDMRRLFLEDDFGFPLRKDFTDESRMIVK